MKMETYCPDIFSTEHSSFSQNLFCSTYIKSFEFTASSSKCLKCQDKITEFYNNNPKCYMKEWIVFCVFSLSCF